MTRKPLITSSMQAMGISCFIIFFLINLLCFVNPAYSQETLTLAIHPYLPEIKLKQKFEPLAEYISKQIGKKVVIRVGSNYQEHIDYIGRDKVDIAYLGPVSYVKVIESYGEKSLLARLEKNGSSTFVGQIIVRQDNPISSLSELNDKFFAFGDPASTMSYIVPYYMLIEAGMTLDSLAGHDFLGGHENVALGVLSGDYDAGAVKEETYNEFKKRGVRSLERTPQISEHLFVCRNGFSQDMIDSIRRALFSLKETESGRQIMRSIKDSITAMVPVDDSDYDNLRLILKKIKEDNDQ